MTAACTEQVHCTISAAAMHSLQLPHNLCPSPNMSCRWHRGSCPLSVPSICKHVAAAVLMAFTAALVPALHAATCVQYTCLKVWGARQMMWVVSGHQTSLCSTCTSTRLSCKQQCNSSMVREAAAGSLNASQLPAQLKLLALTESTKAAAVSTEHAKQLSQGNCAACTVYVQHKHTVVLCHAYTLSHTCLTCKCLLGSHSPVPATEATSRLTCCADSS
jgi:hypothetical protein